MICSNDNGFAIVIELIGSNVYNDIPLLKPRMGLTPSFAKHVIKFTAIILFKIFCKKKCCITTGTKGEITELHSQRFRIALFNCGAEYCDKSFQFIYVTINHDTGDLFVTKNYPIPIKNLVKITDELNEELNRLRGNSQS